MNVKVVLSEAVFLVWLETNWERARPWPRMSFLMFFPYTSCLVPRLTKNTTSVEYFWPKINSGSNNWQMEKTHQNIVENKGYRLLIPVILYVILTSSSIHCLDYSPLTVHVIIVIAMFYQYAVLACIAIWTNILVPIYIFKCKVRYGWIWKTY